MRSTVAARSKVRGGTAAPGCPGERSSPGVRLSFIGLKRVAGLGPAGQPRAGSPYAGFGGKLLCVGDSVNHAPSVLPQVHRPIATEHNSYRPPHPAAFFRFARREPSGNEIFRSALGLAFIVEFYADNFVSGRNAAIPRSVKRDEDVVPILGRELRPFIKRESQRSGVRLNLDLRLDHTLAAVFLSFSSGSSLREG